MMNSWRCGESGFVTLSWYGATKSASKLSHLEVTTSEEEQRDPAPFEKLLVKCWISVPLGSLQLELLQGRQKRLELKFKTLETADSPCLCATLAGMRNNNKRWSTGLAMDRLEDFEQLFRLNRNCNHAATG